ncbi:uncharacterized protein LOC125470488 [Pyrus x bretschneideri]|uniref:uncharacterized protein LOC125470488 n=1 Tax=Pyrus x bretschneideri TaxID=225117 RepID=UPI0020304BA5|nr:uncharacterized protein LOC125470488 [Pyrus x bretschneideri]
MLIASSVLVGEHSSVLGSKGRESNEDDTRDEEGTAVFSSSWLPGKDSKTTQDVRRNGRERLSARTKLPWMKILFRSWYSVLMKKTGLKVTPFRLKKMKWRNQLLRSWKQRSRNTLQINQNRMQQNGQRRERRVVTEETQVSRAPVR